MRGEDEGRDMGNVDGVQLRGSRGKVEGSGLAARVYPYCQGLCDTIDAGMIHRALRNMASYIVL
ncbi:hypothetical protein BDR03DRAFT_965834, partial [Suillus americanus]